MERVSGRFVGGFSVINRAKVAFLDRRRSKEMARAIAAGPTVEDRQAQLVEFYSEYEELVETLCDAAQYGATPQLERKYLALREWMMEHYKPVGSCALAYLKFEVSDGGDAFESLFAAPDLATFLATDDGNMISRIMRTREALHLYGDHLRKLAAA